MTMKKCSVSYERYVKSTSGGELVQAKDLRGMPICYYGKSLTMCPSYLMRHQR